MSTDKNIKITKDNSIKSLFRKNENTDTFIKCRKYARDEDTNVLITGETGTGKEIHARYLHNVSSRADKPFLAVNFSALNHATIYSTLFGHKKGSFTDASADQIGLFKAADGGTIFLDEIGDASFSVQSALLRVLDYGEILALGEVKPQYVDVRIISASNVSFEERIAANKFRQDLYYRLADTVIDLPSLRSKPKDELRNILNDMLVETAHNSKRNKIELTAYAWNKLLSYEFRGNYREAKSIVKRMYNAEKEFLNEEDIELILNPFIGNNTIIYTTPDLSTSAITNLRETKSLDDRIAEIVFETVKKYNGVKKFACEELGISFKTLNKYLKKYSSVRINPIQNSNTDCNYSNDEKKNL